MKFILVISLCLFFAASASAQNEETSTPAEVKVEEITLMRDDGEGNAGEETGIFKTNDIPIHCHILLDSFEPATVKMNFAAVEVKGLKTGTRIVAVSYKTNGKQNMVAFRGSPEKIWLPGKYRADILIDDKIAGSREFEIQKSPARNAAPTNSDKAKTGKRPGKNQ